MSITYFVFSFFLYIFKHMDIDKSNMTRNNIIDNDEIKAINAGLDINNPPNVVEVMVVVVDEIVVAVDDIVVAVELEIFCKF